MASLKFKDVSIEYPIYGSTNLSLTKSLLKVPVGGLLFKNSSGYSSVRALTDISFELSNGDSVGLIGHNGAGKSTLLRTMAGIFSPSNGTVHRAGITATIIELGAGLESELTGYENIFRMGLLLGMTYSAIDKIMPEIESFTELGDFLSMPVRTYSSGMLMRLMFAVSTANKPEILLVDEMFGTGDSSFKEKAQIRMHELIEESKIFVFASHSPDLIKRYCKRIFLLDHGKCVEILMSDAFP